MLGHFDANNLGISRSGHEQNAQPGNGGTQALTGRDSILTLQKKIDDRQIDFFSFRYLKRDLGPVRNSHGVPAQLSVFETKVRTERWSETTKINGRRAAGYRQTYKGIIVPPAQLPST